MGPCFFGMLLGLGCIVASACVLNNYHDRQSDQKMRRTQNRPLARGVISTRSALIFSVVLSLLGAFFLYFLTSLLATVIAFLGLFIYAALYTILKHKTVFATGIGSIAGAFPPLIGYTAQSSAIDLSAFLLFATVALWQMPHFFAIAIYRMEEYRSASIPVFPIQKGIEAAKKRMVLYIALFTITAISPTFFGILSPFYLCSTFLLGAGWFYLAIQGMKKEAAEKWAKKMFFSSLVVIFVLCCSISLDSIWHH